ncbi:MAG TPA: hypothetical protein VMS40_02160, partial [Vicinamibacterales bacterium]|nr:hypothetical protein [Vicinamibacterales bacterium]
QVQVQNRVAQALPRLPAEVQRIGVVTEKSTPDFIMVVHLVSPKHEIEYRTVTLGPIVNGLRVVRSGLKAGEPIVINGLQRIRPGAPVTPLVVPMDADPNTQADAERYGRNNSDERNEPTGPAKAGHYGTN